MTDQAGSDYERSDVNAGGIGLIACGLAACVVAVPLLMPLVFPQSMQRGPPADPPPLRGDAPRLQVAPTKELQHFRSAEQQRLDGYGWIDRDRNIVRIPVTRAIERLVDTGIAGWPSP